MNASNTHDVDVSPSGNDAAKPLLVLGLGNSLLGDDGTGPRVVARLRAVSGLPAGTSLLDGGTLSFTLLAEIEDAGGLIAVDAAELDAAPGTVRVLEGEAMDAFLRSGRCASVHEVSLSELIDMARLTDHLPERRALVAVQPEHIGWATELSPAVDMGLQLACNRVGDLLLAWAP